ncbi:MAG: TauD/TfdA family dioxygenase [Rhodospirillales bacterium]
MSSLAQAAKSPISVEPTDAPLGAYIHGVDLSKGVDAEEFAIIEQAWNERLVVVLRNQKISDEDLMAFSELWGELDPPAANPYGKQMHPKYGVINVISNIVENGEPQGILGAGEAVWHADLTYIDTPPKAAILHSLEIPDDGGNTYFANMYAAYEALPDEMKQRIDGLKAVHDCSHNSAGQLRRGFEETTDVTKTPGVHHPLVRTNPVDGRKCLFLGRRPYAWIVGMEVAESEKLLDDLWAHASKPEFAWGHSWQLGDVLIWNNLSVLHRRDPFDPNQRRRMHRTQIKGQEVIG